MDMQGSDWQLSPIFGLRAALWRVHGFNEKSFKYNSKFQELKGLYQRYTLVYLHIEIVVLPGITSPHCGIE